MRQLWPSIGPRIVLVILVAVIGGCADPSGASGPDVTSVGFGTDGSPCELSGVASTFPAGVRVHTLLTLQPALPTGGTVTVDLERDAVALPEFSQTVIVDEPAPCNYGALESLEVGHYRMTFHITPSQMPPVVGEFDITQ